MSIFSDGLWSDPPLATPAPHEAAQRKRPSADEPVQVAMRPKAAGQQAPSTDQKKVRRAIGRGVRKSADITGTRKPDLDDLTDEERASEQQAAYDDENPPMRQSGARTKESTMAQPTEAQILAAMAVATPGERARLVASLDDLRAQRRLAVQDQADLDLSRQVVAAHLTPVLVHQRSNAETDWLGVVATQEQDPTIAAKTAATNWYRKVSAEVKADEEEFVIQAQGAARRASSGYGQWMAVAERAFLDHVAHLAGGESKTAGRHLANSAAYNAGFADAQEGKDKGRGASDPEYMRGYNDAAVQSWLDFVGVNKTSNDAVDPQNGQANSSLTDYQDLSPVTDDAAFDEGWATNPEPSQVNDTDEDAYRQAEEDQDEVTRPYSASKTAGDGFLTPEQQAWLSARGSKTAGLDWHPAASFPGLPSLGDSADLPNGGSVLVATGPDDGKVEAVYFTPQGALVQLLTDAGSVDHAKSLVESKVDELMAMSSLHTAARSLSEIASEIRADWKNVYFGAVPYLDAMESLDSMSDRYYEDDADSIVTYFLSNATTWRGETAKRIKDELKSMSRYGSRTAADEQTCSVCGDKIAKNPEDDGYHHDNGEKHDHEAKPGKESALKTASSDIVAVTHNDTGMMHHLADG